MSTLLTDVTGRGCGMAENDWTYNDNDNEKVYLDIQNVDQHKFKYTLLFNKQYKVIGYMKKCKQISPHQS